MCKCRDEKDNKDSKKNGNSFTLKYLFININRP